MKHALLVVGLGIVGYCLWHKAQIATKAPTFNAGVVGTSGGGSAGNHALGLYPMTNASDAVGLEGGSFTPVGGHPQIGLDVMDRALPVRRSSPDALEASAVLSRSVHPLDFTI